MRNLLVLSLLSLSLSTVANATKEFTEKSNIFLDKEGKQISASEAWRSDDPIFECVKKEVKNNSRTGKPKMVKVD